MFPFVPAWRRGPTGKHNETLRLIGLESGIQQRKQHCHDPRRHHNLARVALSNPGCRFALSTVVFPLTLTRPTSHYVRNMRSRILFCYVSASLVKNAIFHCAGE